MSMEQFKARVEREAAEMNEADLMEGIRRVYLETGKAFDAMFEIFCDELNARFNWTAEKLENFCDKIA